MRGSGLRLFSNRGVKPTPAANVDGSTPATPSAPPSAPSAPAASSPPSPSFDLRPAPLATSTTEESADFRPPVSTPGEPTIPADTPVQPKRPKKDTPPLTQSSKSPTAAQRSTVAVLAPVVSLVTRSTTAIQSQAAATASHLTRILLPNLSTHLNTLTGYSVVARAKQRVLEKDDQLNDAKRRSDTAKKGYETMIEERRKCQRELNSLLQRKDTWLDSDITRFTELYRKDLSLEQAETGAKVEYKDAVEEFERAHREYLNEIRERYIEEQLYSDKIRRASTWWTWGLISLHFCLFLAVQLFVEPRKRRKLKEDIVGALGFSEGVEGGTVEGMKVGGEGQHAMSKVLEELQSIGRRVEVLQGSVGGGGGGGAVALAASQHPPISTTLSTHPTIAPATSSPLYPKDKLFAKGVLCGAVLGVAVSSVFAYGF
ncbi:Mdm33 family-domain-containing protein [Fimicolochytrium jonesii]|uniref:Mdm33 family-domain-containing protein n=1 Tax=Fimicolochytrium jonesii TaxID=1396493 RepID=UPI0022FEF883|nr:Mdm33 family-domain-containing protein [Fimicolochytrium jonesii]KAI8816864.1 Mdm33 family-domain-containing protein [Fimicolochytrium jonesii]